MVLDTGAFGVYFRNYGGADFASIWVILVRLILWVLSHMQRFKRASEDVQNLICPLAIVTELCEGEKALASPADR